MSIFFFKFSDIDRISGYTEHTNFRHAKKRKPSFLRSMGLGKTGQRWSAMRGPLLEAVRASGRPFFGGRARRGFVQLRNEGAQSPRSAKKRISHLSAPGARRRHGCRRFLDGCEKPNSRESASPPGLPLSKITSKESIFQACRTILGAAYTCLYIKPHSAKLFVSEPAMMK